MNFSFQFPIILVMMIVTGCATADATLIDPSRIYEPTDNVVLIVDEPNEPYEVIAIIEGNGSQYNNQSDVLKSIRKEAMKVGAHAILPISTEKEYVPTTMHANPVAGSPPITLAGGNKIIMKVAAIRFVDR